jgi:uncharacterized protein involved in cysteine biosynthesis
MNTCSQRTNSRFSGEKRYTSIFKATKTSAPEPLTDSSFQQLRYLLVKLLVLLQLLVVPAFEQVELRYC